MKTATIAETKNSLSALIDGLRTGAPVLILDRGRPVARLDPVSSTAEEASDGRLSRRLRDGVVRPRRSDPPLALFSSKPPRLRAGLSEVDALTKDRLEGW